MNTEAKETEKGTKAPAKAKEPVEKFYDASTDPNSYPWSKKGNEVGKLRAPWAIKARNPHGRDVVVLESNPIFELAVNNRDGWKALEPPYIDEKAHPWILVKEGED